jgi:hypothetical protein
MTPFGFPRSAWVVDHSGRLDLQKKPVIQNGCDPSLPAALGIDLRASLSIALTGHMDEFKGLIAIAVFLSFWGGMFYLDNAWKRGVKVSRIEKKLGDVQQDLRDANATLESQGLSGRKHQEKTEVIEAECEAIKAKYVDLSKRGKVIAAARLELYECFKQDGVKLANMMADYETLDFGITARYLETKKNPAYVKAKDVRALREVSREAVARSKEMAYRWEALLTAFPDLEPFVDSLDTITNLANFKDIEDFESGVDRTLSFLSKEEYEDLDVLQRNQLALDRYIERRKSKWQIGRDYELFIAHSYEQRGWKVSRIGVELRLDDMGRDVMAYKGNVTHVVQAKYWAQFKQIHENHICQLYGTTRYYAKEHPLEKVVPVLITNIVLSDRARDFALLLGVTIKEEVAMGDFPRIKCNVNRSTKDKIYHLPMDQLYDRTKINSNGEFFAMTVVEAETAGFRRAAKWIGS